MNDIDNQQDDTSLRIENEIKPRNTRKSRSNKLEKDEEDKANKENPEEMEMSTRKVRKIRLKNSNENLNEPDGGRIKEAYETDQKNEEEEKKNKPKRKRKKIDFVKNQGKKNIFKKKI